MNQAGLQDIQIMLADLEIHNWITGPNCDKSWYLNIRKEKEFLKSQTENLKGLEDWLSNKFLDITKLWKKYCDTLNKDIIITAKTGKLSGKAVGIDENCSLLLKLNNNRIIKIIEGDIAYHIYSVRKDFF